MMQNSMQAPKSGIHPDLATVHDRMLDGLGQLADYLGFSKVMGQLYGALMLSGQAMSLDDLMERLDISKASVSTNMRTLEHMGMVRQVWMRGKNGRRKYYEAEGDFVQIITNILSRREMRDVDRALAVMEENSERLRNSLEGMSEDDRTIAEIYLEKIAHMEKMFRFAQLVIAGILAQVAELDLDSVNTVDMH